MPKRCWGNNAEIKKYIHEMHKYQNLKAPRNSKIFSLEFMLFFLNHSMQDAATRKELMHMPASAWRVKTTRKVLLDKVLLYQCCSAILHQGQLFCAGAEVSWDVCLCEEMELYRAGGTSVLLPPRAAQVLGCKCARYPLTQHRCQPSAFEFQLVTGRLCETLSGKVPLGLGLRGAWHAESSYRADGS